MPLFLFYKLTLVRDSLLNVANSFKFPVGAYTCVNIDATGSFTVFHRPKMNLTIFMLPDNVIGTIAIDIARPFKMPVGAYRFVNIDAAGSFTVFHRPKMNLTIFMLPDNVVSFM